jgi:hypothetical protein
VKASNTSDALLSGWRTVSMECDLRCLAVDDHRRVEEPTAPGTQIFEHNAVSLSAGDCGAINPQLTRTDRHATSPEMVGDGATRAPHAACDSTALRGCSDPGEPG